MLGIDILSNDCRITDEIVGLIETRKNAFSMLWLDSEVSIYLNEDVLTLQAEIGKAYKVSLLASY